MPAAGLEDNDGVGHMAWRIGLDRHCDLTTRVPPNAKLREPVTRLRTCPNPSSPLPIAASRASCCWSGPVAFLGPQPVCGASPTTRASTAPGRSIGNRADWRRPGPACEPWTSSGIILRDVENLDEVKSCGIPAVVVGHNRLEIQGLANVVTDSDGIAHLAAEHLLARGFRHFAYCGLEGLPWLPRSAARRSGDASSAPGMLSMFTRRREPGFAGVGRRNGVRWRIG